MNKIILLDSNSLLHRAYYALAKSNLTDSKGNPTGAVFGFASMLARLIQEEKPTHIAAAFDLRAPTFRHKMYEAYKGTRKPMPEDLVPQVPMIKELLRAFKIAIVEMEGYEADDIIGTIAKRFDQPTLIVTGDRDSLQLIDDSTRVYFTRRGISDVVVYDEARLLEEGFTPQRIIDYKSLRGDASDNIPGISGIGEKTAVNLLSEYGSLEGVIANVDKIEGKLGEKIRSGEASARLSYKLAAIDTNVPVKCSLDDLAFAYPLDAEAKKELYSLEFNSLIKRFKFAESGEISVLTEQKEITTVEFDNIADFAELIKNNAEKPVALAVSEDMARVAFSADTEYKIAASYDLFGGINPNDIINALKPALEAASDKTVADYKKLLHTVREYGIKINGRIYDAFLLAYLVKGGQTFNSVEALNNAYGFESASVAALTDTAGVLLKELKDKGLEKLYYEMELPLSEILFKMEVEGIRVNRSVLAELKTKYSDELENLTRDIYGYAGESFNINSPKQLTVILFEKLGLKSRKKNKTGLSADIDVLMSLYDDHPIVPLIIRYRQLSKLQSTYVLGLEKEIAADGKIHTDFRQTVTTTGRLSSIAPNLQNIPTRTSEGREIRKAFIADEGKVLIAADYSQIELRLMAHMSGDENLIRAYNESRDIHTATASEIYGVPPDAVTSEMRRNAKAVNFGIIYGISDFGLAHNLSIRPKEAKSYIEKYFATYPKVREFMDNQVKFAQENGYAKSLFGRIRVMAELKSPNYAVREFGKRAAMNFPLQGTAADIIKLAMIAVDKQLEATGAKMLLQVHDELIAEAPESEADNIKKLLIDCMENTVKLSVPLTVNVSEGKSWYEA